MSFHPSQLLRGFGGGAATAMTPVLIGDPYQGQELTSTDNKEWLINGVPTGVVGDTFTVPESALLGDEITQAGSNVLTVIRIPDSIGIRIDTELPGSASNTMVIPAANNGSYDARIYWGDGSWDDVTTYNAAELTHEYPEPGLYDIQISGTFRVLYFNNGGDRQKLLRIDQWGDTGQASNQTFAFYGCVNLTTLPDDMTLPNLTNGNGMFYSTSLTTLPDDMTLPNLATGTGMFDGTTLTTTRYSQLLIDLSAHNPNDNVVFHGGNAKYNEIAAPARYALYMRQWTITDGGADFETPILFGLPHAESVLWSTHTGQWAIDGTPVVGETGQTFTIPDDVTDGQEITQLDSDPLIVSNLDPDALNYILRVEGADQYPLEPAVKTAINDLFLAWKDAPAPIAANNWAAIAAGTGLLMAGPRTLAGALVPLAPNMPAPTNVNFVQGDYNRKTGLKGARSPSKNLVWNSFPNDLLPVDDVSLWSYLTSIPATGAPEYLATFSNGGSPGMTRLSEDGTFESYLRNARYDPVIPRSALPEPGLFGASRVAGVKTNFAFGTSASAAISNSSTATVDPFALFRWRNVGETSTARIIAAGCGEALDLEAMDAALTAYMAAIDSAI